MKWLDLPPVWLVAFIAAAAGQAHFLQLGLSFGGYWSDFVSGILIGGGVVLTVLAVFELRRARTTIVPHQEPDQLVRTGIFRRTRNPIYLGDVLILAGVILWMDAVLSLPLVPIFLWVLERRFVEPEEDRLQRRFRADFARYAQATPRWIGKTRHK